MSGPERQGRRKASRKTVTASSRSSAAIMHVTDETEVLMPWILIS
jgi:hypothetical protein